jgi:membrane protein DedA with SNARE-associated domain
MEHVDQFLANYGYFALFGLLMLGIVGPLIPDESILVLAGIAIHRGQMHSAAALGAAFGGSVCGITLSYLLGRTGAVYALERIPFLKRHTRRHLPQARIWFERYGKWTLFIGYFIVGIRHFTALVAGLTGVRLPAFAAYAYPGGFLWVACFLAVGYYLGEGWEQVTHRLDMTVAVVAAVVAFGALVWWRLKRKNT